MTPILRGGLFSVWKFPEDYSEQYIILWEDRVYQHKRGEKMISENDYRKFQKKKNKCHQIRMALEWCSLKGLI
jgi:hypothetical protein